MTFVTALTRTYVTATLLVLLSTVFPTSTASHDFGTKTDRNIKLQFKDSSSPNNNIRIKSGDLKKLGSILSWFHLEQEKYKDSIHITGKPGGPLIVNGKITVKVVGTQQDGLQESLVSVLGKDVLTCLNNICTVRCLPKKLLAVAALQTVVFLGPVFVASRAGSVTSEGDHAMYADNARGVFGVTGVGSKIGVISDSYNCSGGASADVASGDLPTNVEVLKDIDDCGWGTDEGRAMMQLAYDVAPGASLMFRTGYISEIDMANGIRELAAAGCNIIVDDIGYLNEPFFQDGLIAQAADEVVALHGVSYFTAAGNAKGQVWDGADGFRDSGMLFQNKPVHQFATDASGTPIVSQQITIYNSGNYASLFFQWDESFRSATGSLAVGSRSDLDIYVTHNGVIVGSGVDNNINRDPFEQIWIDTSTIYSAETTLTLSMYIVLNSGPAPTHMRVLSYGVDSMEFTTDDSPDIFGHSNAANVVAVGASNWYHTPAYGRSPPELEYFSSIGPTPILVDTSGNRLASPSNRQQPRMIGPDGAGNTFLGGAHGSHFDFLGTSAAAPHVAAVAALIVEASRVRLTPEEIYALMGSTAVDMDVTGYDYRTGYGLVNAQAAVGAAAALAPSPANSLTRVPTMVPTKSPTKKPITKTPTTTPTKKPSTKTPTRLPTKKPTKVPTKKPIAPTKAPTKKPTSIPTKKPIAPTKAPTKKPIAPTRFPTKKPIAPTRFPTKKPFAPTKIPTKKPIAPTRIPTKKPTKTPTKKPTKTPTKKPTKVPTKKPTKAPTKKPTKAPTKKPTKKPTNKPTKKPTNKPITLLFASPIEKLSAKDKLPLLVQQCVKETAPGCNCDLKQKGKICARVSSRTLCTWPGSRTQVKQFPKLVEKAYVTYCKQVKSNDVTFDNGEKR